MELSTTGCATRSPITVTNAELVLYHTLHLSLQVPQISFGEDIEIVEQDEEEEEATAQPSFQITDLVNDYYNIRPAQGLELTESQRAYLKFKEEHMKKFHRDYKSYSQGYGARFSKRDAKEQQQEEEEYVELDY